MRLFFYMVFVLLVGCGQASAQGGNSTDASPPPSNLKKADIQQLDAALASLADAHRIQKAQGATRSAEEKLDAAKQRLGEWLDARRSTGLIGECVIEEVNGRNLSCSPSKTLTLRLYPSSGGPYYIKDRITFIVWPSKYEGTERFFDLSLEEVPVSGMLGLSNSTDVVMTISSEYVQIKVLK